MNIYDDKTVYKIIAGIFVTFSVLMIISAAAHGGLKTALFAVWLIVAVIILATVFSSSIKANLPKDAKSPVENFMAVYWNYFCFRTFLWFIIFLLCVASLFVWEYLDQRFPAQQESTL